jgi:hypothetical protein
MLANLQADLLLRHYNTFSEEIVRQASGETLASACCLVHAADSWNMQQSLTTHRLQEASTLTSSSTNGA